MGFEKNKKNQVFQFFFPLLPNKRETFWHQKKTQTPEFFFLLVLALGGGKLWTLSRLESGFWANFSFLDECGGTLQKTAGKYFPCWIKI